MIGGELEQIPQVPVQILEHRHSAVLCLFRLSDEFNPLGDHLVIVAPEVVGAQKEKNSPAGLVADEGFLLWL